MDKPTVEIKEWGIYRRYPGKPHPWALDGVITVSHHPQQITSGPIVAFTRADLEALHAGDVVETQDIRYLLVGNNQNGKSAAP